MTLHAGQWEYTGLSGGRTTVDADFQLAAPPMARNPYAPQDEGPCAASSPRKIGVDPSEDTRLPLGDAVLPLMLFVAGYAAYKYKRRRKEC